MRKWVLIGVLGVAGLIALIGGIGWFVLSKPMDPSSPVGQGYAAGFKRSFIESCVEEAIVENADDAMREKIRMACECGAEASYHELEDVPVTEQYSKLQEPAMQQNIATIMAGCMQNAGLQ